MRLGDFALSDTAFPHLTLVRQADVEAVLAEALHERGVHIERGTVFTAVQDCPAAAHITLQSTTSTETTPFHFVVGCDGQTSTVREAVGIAWRGRRYAEEVVLADVELDANLASNVAHGFVARRGVLLLFALGEHATWRLLATRPTGRNRSPCGQPGPPVDCIELQALLDHAGIRGRITRVAWSARYALQHRLAARFRKGHLFLAGDAAHAHSPATGQGMNTGIQDAVNLGWKLAFAATAKEATALLDSYEVERLPVARGVLALTHLAFWAEANCGLVPSTLRGTIAPLLTPALPSVLSSRRLVAEVFRCVSQFRVGYRRSPISVEGQPARPRCGLPPGERLGDTAVAIDGQWTRLHTLLAHAGVHVLLQRDAPVSDKVALGPDVTVIRLASVAGTGVLAVRPDGYVGYRSGLADLAQIRAWLARIGAAEWTTAP